LNQLSSAAQRANLQGQTIVTPSGDSGAADCDSGATATRGLAVDFPSSMPYVTSAGGSEFTGDAASNPACSATPYWTGGQCLPQDTSATALSYIPEMVWNDTSTDGSLSAAGGGLSTIFAEPAWQMGLSAITNGMRGVPDLSFAASADHDGYLICSQGSCLCGFRDSCSGNFNVVGGTSASTPAFAAIVALINQKTGQSQGNLNSQLYSLAMNTSGIFHDITLGNNIVPCRRGTTGCPSTAPFQYGYSAGPGYDLASGWGSLDATALASAWNGTTFATLTVNKTGSGTVTSSDGHINCGNICTFTYNSGAHVTLTATPAPGWIFSSWSGCDSTQNNTCSVTMNNSRTVQVTFVEILQSLVFRPATVRATSIAIGTLTLAAPAPNGGLSVRLSSSNPRAASVPTSVVVVAGHSSIRVYARTYHVRPQTPVTITVSQGTASTSANLTVDP
jgi:subtilase family serine protease